MNTEQPTMTLYIEFSKVPESVFDVAFTLELRIWCGESGVGREARRRETLLGRVHCPGHCTRASASGSGWDSQQGNSTNGGDFQAQALHHPRLLLPVTHLCCLPAGTFPWSSGGFHVACSNTAYKNNNNQQSISSVQLKYSYVWWNLY